ncbi:MAG TPA: hypothetical protein VIK10_12545 [Prolixibacteraceae bacterium]
MKIRLKIAPGYEVLEDWLAKLPEHFQNGGVSIFKDRNEVKVFNEMGFELNIKSFKVTHLINRFAYIYFRGSKAARSFLNAVRLLASGASTPEPVAYVECLSMGILGRSYYISLQYLHDFTLRDVLDYEIPDRQNILTQWVHFTWLHLHKNGIFHLDYSPGNTLIRKEGEQYQFAIVDLNRMKFLPVDFGKGIQNFRQLHTDEETIRLIATQYAALCGSSAEKAIEMLLKLDGSSKKFRARKNKFHKFFGPAED